MPPALKLTGVVWFIGGYRVALLFNLDWITFPLDCDLDRVLFTFDSGNNKYMMNK